MPAQTIEFNNLIAFMHQLSTLQKNKGAVKQFMKADKTYNAEAILNSIIQTIFPVSNDGGYTWTYQCGAFMNCVYGYLPVSESVETLNLMKNHLIQSCTYLM
jgi:hypothetical protein